MSTIKNQPLRVLTDLTSNIKAQIDSQRPEDGDYSREITIRLAAIDAILAHCSLSVFNNDPQPEDEEDDADLATLQQQVFGGTTPNKVRDTTGLSPVGGAEPESLALADEAEFPDGIYRMEFDCRDNRKYGSASDLQAIVVEGPAEGMRIGETLAFTSMFGADMRAARAKARRYAQVFDLREDESDAEAFLFHPFIAEVRNGVIVEMGVDSLSPLPAGRPRKLLRATWGAEFAPLDRQAA